MSLRNIENMQEYQKRKKQKNFLECEKKMQRRHKQTCKSDELFHEIGMVRLQPEVISCTEWCVFVVFVWDDALATDVAVCVVWVRGNGDVPKLFVFPYIFVAAKSRGKKIRKSFAKKLVLKLITIVWLRFWWCRYCRFCRCRFWRRIIRRIKSINLITTAVAAAVVINAILLQLLRWYWTARTNVLTFYCNIIDRRNWRNLWKSQKAIMR